MTTVKCPERLDFEYATKCLQDALSGEVDHWEPEQFRLFNEFTERLDDILPYLPGLGLAQVYARTAMIELMKRVSIAGKIRLLDRNACRH